MSVGRVAKQLIGRVFPRALLYRGGHPDRCRLALTFDDGPHPAHTPQILDILARQEITATFFLQGAEVEKHPALVRRMLAEGHAIGNHAYTHRRPGEIGVARYVHEVLRTHRLLEQTTGTALPRLFRPPYGALNIPAFTALVRRGFRIVYWSADSEDSFVREPDALAQRVEKLPLRGGDILLFHEDYPHTVAALDRMTSGLKNRGFELVSITAL